MATTMDTGLLTELRRAVDQSGSWTLMRDSYEAHQLLRFYPDFVDYEIDEDGYAVFTLTPEGMAATTPMKSGKDEVKQMLNQSIKVEKSEMTAGMEFWLRRLAAYGPTTIIFGTDFDTPENLDDLHALSTLYYAKVLHLDSERIVYAITDLGKQWYQNDFAKSTKSALAAKLDEKIEKRISGISMAAEALLQRMHHNMFVAGNQDMPILANTSDADATIFELTGRGWARFIEMDTIDGIPYKVYQLTNEGIAAAEESLGLNKATKSADPNGYNENQILWQASNQGYIRINPGFQSDEFIYALTSLIDDGYLSRGGSNALGNTYYLTEKGKEFISLDAMQPRSAKGIK